MKQATALSPKIQIGFLGLWRFGYTRNTGGTSDFTASGVSQVTVLTAIKPGDRVLCGLAQLDVITPIVTPAATFFAKIGIVGTDARVIANTDLKLTTSKYLAPTVTADALQYVNQTTSDVNLILTLTAGSGNVSDVTAGEIQILVPIVRRTDRIDTMEM